MKVFENNYQIDISNISDFEEKTLSYFKKYQFTVTNQEKNKIFLKIKGSILDVWKMNPFKWESSIEIKIKNNIAKIKYTTEGVYLSTVIFSSFYNTFIKNYLQFVTASKSFEKDNAILIKKATKQSYIYNFFLLILIVIGIIAGNYVATVVKNNLIKYFVIVLFAWGGEKLLTSLIVKKQQKQILQNPT